MQQTLHELTFSMTHVCRPNLGSCVALAAHPKRPADYKQDLICYGGGSLRKAPSDRDAPAPLNVAVVAVASAGLYTTREKGVTNK